MSLAFAILGLLSYKQMTGYDLKNVFDASIKNIWPAHLSQIYRELSGLEGKDLVVSHTETQESRPDRKVYSLTDKGRDELNQWLNQTPQNFVSFTRDETALRMFFGSKIDKDEMIFQLKTLIKQKKETIDVLHEIDAQIRNSSSETDKKFWLLSVMKGYKIAEAELSWAEVCIEELESMHDS
ncbi:PadR family transcriptional regulator [Paenibacillus taihuensis]|uniref:PadR family transcriptional regulator n=1 Tax=Paenibacillus taihuensis TaxID=1156355 RepID=A0A3D9RNV7_9BACL|nr:PadR family transcriptional regulator [Paenibacillus taihuensis]REE77682.1 PadR family transcriptional regulator [Paenibacillus taihuensis]